MNQAYSETLMLWLKNGTQDIIKRRSKMKISESEVKYIIKGLESVKEECGRYLDESFAWICEPIDMAIEALKKQTGKTGRWIEETDDYGKVIGWHCDNCYEDSGFTTDCKWHFCPNCGARMIDPQKSEVQE